MTEPIPPTAYRVLTIMWARALVADGVAFVALRRRDLAEVLNMTIRTASRAIGALKKAGLITKAARPFAGILLRGWDLARGRAAPLREKSTKRSSATDKDVTATVANREKKRTMIDDLVAIARIAGRGDGERMITERLIRQKVPCSVGRWHHIKVHRRIERMRDELGRGVGMRAGDAAHLAGLRAGEVAHRWKVARGA